MKKLFFILFTFLYLPVKSQIIDKISKKPYLYKIPMTNSSEWIIDTLEYNDDSKIYTQKIHFKIKIDHPGSNWNGKTIEDSFIMSMSSNSSDVFSLGRDIEKYTGLNLQYSISHPDTPDNAYIFGLCNFMNNGKDVFFWTNGRRLAGESRKCSSTIAIMEHLTHEVGVHLSRQLLVRHIAKENGLSLDNEDYLQYDYGFGKGVWPPISDDNLKNTIDEETFATFSGALIRVVADNFISLSYKFIYDGKN